MKIIKIDNVLKDLDEWFSLVETPDWRPATLNRHYNDHVLKPGEKFNPDDPKFPPMTKEEYAEEAKILADEYAMPIDDNNIADTIGWVIIEPKKSYDRKSSFQKQQQNKNNLTKDDPRRIIKIRQTSKFNPKFCDVVMYKDNQYDSNIFSFMLGRPERIESWASQYQHNLNSQGPLRDPATMDPSDPNYIKYTTTDPLYEKKYMDDKVYKGYIISKDGTSDYPYNVYKPNPLPNFPNNKIHVGFGRTIKSCKEDIDGGWFDDVDRDI